DREDVLGALGQCAHVRVGGGLVSRDYEQRDRLGVYTFSVRGGRPRVRATAAVGGAWQVERARAGLGREPELPRECRAVGAPRSFLARPDQDCALALAQLLAELVAGLREAAAAFEGVPRVLDPRAVTAGRPQPEVDDRRPLGDRLVAEDHDQLGVADRRERQAEAIQGGARLL